MINYMLATPTLAFVLATTYLKALGHGIIVYPGGQGPSSAYPQDAQLLYKARLLYMALHRQQGTRLWNEYFLYQEY